MQVHFPNKVSHLYFLSKHFIKVYKDLGSEALEPIPVALLLKHPFMQDLINNYQGYKLHVSILFLVSTRYSEPFNFHCSEDKML